MAEHFMWLEYDQAFYVHASNIHNNEMETYGPFPGSALLTYEFLRDGEGSHIFSYADPVFSDQAEEDDHWTDQEGDTRYDGWRRCYDTDRQFGYATGPFWTDLGIVSFVLTPGDHSPERRYDPQTYNRLPSQAEAPTRPTPATTETAWT